MSGTAEIRELDVPRRAAVQQHPELESFMVGEFQRLDDVAVALLDGDEPARTPALALAWSVIVAIAMIVGSAQSDRTVDFVRPIAGTATDFFPNAPI